MTKATSKIKTAYVCNECGDDFAKWQGQCTTCVAWNSLSEVRLGAGGGGSAPITSARKGYAGTADNKIQALADINLEEMPRITTGTQEFDRVLGGGLVSGSVVLIGGHPGAGKSTLLLQVLCHLSEAHTTLYVTGEESLQQVAMRAQRLGLQSQNLNS